MDSVSCAQRAPSVMEDIKPVSPVGAIIFVLWVIVSSGLAVTRLFLYPVACDVNRRIHARIEPTSRLRFRRLAIFFFFFCGTFCRRCVPLGDFLTLFMFFSSSPFRLNNSYFLSVPNSICFINDNSETSRKIQRVLNCKSSAFVKQ